MLGLQVGALPEQARHGGSEEDRGEEPPHGGVYRTARGDEAVILVNERLLVSQRRRHLC